MTTTHTTLNGVDLARLQETVAAIQDRPELARFEFRAETSWVRGGHVRTKPREDLEALCDYVKSTTPVLDMLTKPVPVSVTLAS